jgi:hypothetical protein
VVSRPDPSDSGADDLLRSCALWRTHRRNGTVTIDVPASLKNADRAPIFTA